MKNLACGGAGGEIPPQVFSFFYVFTTKKQAALWAACFAFERCSVAFYEAIHPPSIKVMVPVV